MLTISGVSNNKYCVSAKAKTPTDWTYGDCDPEWMAANHLDYGNDACWARWAYVADSASGAGGQAISAECKTKYGDKITSAVATLTKLFDDKLAWYRPKTVTATPATPATTTDTPVIVSVPFYKKPLFWAGAVVVLGGVATVVYVQRKRNRG